MEINGQKRTLCVQTLINTNKH